MQTVIGAQSFSAMRGDIVLDNQVRFSSGQIVTIKQPGYVWEIVNSTGETLARCPTALELESWIVFHENNS